MSEITRGATRKGIQFLLLTLAILVIAFTLVRAQVPPVELEAGQPGVGLVGQRLMIAVPITNDGTLAATNVQVTAVTLPPAQPISPATLPAPVGTIGPEQTAVFQADFDASGLAYKVIYVLTITGTYQVNEVSFNFSLTASISLPPATPRSAATEAGTATAESLSGAPFPASPFAVEADSDHGGRPVPTGPFVPGTQTRSTSVQPAGGSPTAGSAVTFNTNDSLGSLPACSMAELGGCNSVDPVEPSGAENGGGVVFVTFNWAAAYSDNGGSSFTLLDPHTMFPQTPYVLCCDQLVQYVPSIDSFVWLQQLYEGGPGTPGAYRLAAASPANIITYKGQTQAWKSWVFTPEDMHSAHATEFDRPSMSVGSNYLYIAWDQSCPSPLPPSTFGCINGREVIRVKLSQIQAGGPTVHFDYLVDPSFDDISVASGDAWGNSLTEDTGDEVFWAGLNSTASLRVFSWSEGSSLIYAHRDIGLTTWVMNVGDGAPGHTPSIAPLPVPSMSGLTGPTRRDWLYRSSGQWGAATRSGDSVWFAWNSGPHDSFPQPYIEMVEINTSGAHFAKVQQVQIWNPDFAFGIPSLATNACDNEIGLSLNYGGGGYYPNHAVGFWGDYVVYATTTGNVTSPYYGDYVTIHQHNTPGLSAFFDAFGYALENAGTSGDAVIPLSQVNVDVRYVVFGRSGACSQ
jgi:hypothetical protein